MRMMAVVVLVVVGGTGRMHVLLKIQRGGVRLCRLSVYSASRVGGGRIFQWSPMAHDRPTKGSLLKVTTEGLGKDSPPRFQSTLKGMFHAPVTQLMDCFGKDERKRVCKKANKRFTNVFAY